MAAVSWGTRTDLALRMGGEARLVQFFDDDGDGVVADGDAQLVQAMTDADDVVTGILLDKGWSLAQLALLVGDRQVTRSWAGIAAQLAGERRPEFFDDKGLGPFDAIGQRGRMDLGKLAQGQVRSRREQETGGPGRNPLQEAAVTDRALIFNPDPRDPNRYGPGGF
jgi:hypothetical protein